MPRPRGVDHDRDRQREALRLLREVLPDWDRWLIGGDAIATFINAHGFRTWKRNLLVNAKRVRRWTAAGVLPSTRGVPGHRGRPVAIPQSVLTAWLIGGARGFVKLDRNRFGAAARPEYRQGLIHPTVSRRRRRVEDEVSSPSTG